MSTEEQAHQGVSLDAQEARIRSYCMAMGLDLEGIYRDEGVSAGIPLESRPQGAAMLAAVTSRHACHIVAMKLDRLFRNALDCLANVEKWDRAGVGLHLLDLNVNTSTAAGKMFLHMAAGFAEMERNLIRERTQGALAHKKASLQVYNHTPFGYDRHGRDLVPNAQEQAIIERIRAMDASGIAMLQIAATLNAAGVPTKKGGRWFASTIRAILLNPMHASA